MILGAERIRALLAEQVLQIDPMDPARLGVASYTLTLSNTFRRWRSASAVDLADGEWNVDGQLGKMEELDSLTISPGEFVLGASVEALSLPANVIGQLSTPSHMARFGLSFIQSSALVHPGFGRPPTQITFEITCVNPAPVTIPTGLPVCHLVLSEVSDGGNGAGASQRSVYEGSPAPSPPKLPSNWLSRKGPL